MESSRMVFITGLAPDRKYNVRLAPDRTLVFESTGKALAEEGFKVTFEKMTEGNIYEVEEVREE
jgi:hypothetical protein